jgi:hexosaminidase
MVDAESFPFVSPSEPTMSSAAFSPNMIYTVEDIQRVTAYGYERGVEVIPELDIPGHAASWTKGKPEIMADCFAKYYYNINDFALNPSLDETYTVVNNILTDLVKASGSMTNKIHLGGDEVVYGCWRNDTSIIDFYNSQGYTSYDQVLSYFVNKVDNGLNAVFPGIKVIHWEEVFTANCAVMPGQTIYQVWTDSSMISALTQAHYPVIASPSNYWYLNIPANTWQVMYNYDPTVGLSADQAKYIIGGETALWGEYIDQYNIENNVYPRAAAVAERLWSLASLTPVNTDDTTARLIIQKCRLMNRGIHSSPVKPADYCEKTYI